MKLYNECIAGLEKMLDSCGIRRVDTDVRTVPWEDEGRNQLIFRQDMAYELGGDKLPAISGILLTDSTECVPGDEIWLCGNDLPHITEDVPYARIVLVRVKENALGDADALYRMVRKIEYTRYHLNPRGFMMRISALNQRETVRIDRRALQDGMNFSSVGGLFLKAYHKHPEVEAVKLIFVTESDFPYEELSELMQKSENITKTLDHLLKKVDMDCNACRLKDICAEVEELYQSETEH